MSKIITVWGSPGSGKSMFCSVLAKMVTREKQHKAIIISGDQMTPMLPVWLPDQIIETESSVGNVLTSLEIDSAITASHVMVLKSFPFIGVMGYAAKENPLSYPEVRYEKYRELFSSAARLVDYVILDCPSSLTCLFTPAAIESAHLSICMLTPDLKGINYLQAQQALLIDPKFKFDSHLYLAGMARPYHALDEMGHIVGGFAGLFPYTKEIDRCATEGGMFSALGHCGKKHLLSLQKVIDTVSDEPTAEEKETLPTRKKPKPEKPRREKKTLWGKKKAPESVEDPDAEEEDRSDEQ